MITDTGKLRKAMKDISTKKGDFTLFGIFMRPEAPGTWDLVVSAPWLESGKLKALSEFTKLLSNSIGEEGLQQFSRIVTVKRTDPWLKALITRFSVDDDAELRLQHSNLLGREIEDAIILRAKRAAA